MENKILKSLGNKKLTMIQILQNIGVPFQFKKEYSEKVTEMANTGKIIRTWDESGMAFYEKRVMA